MVFLVLVIFLLGSAVGSFLNVVIDRTVNGGSILGRSQCDYCKMKLSAIDLVPILSFILLGGRCRNCHKKLSFQYPIVELLGGVLFATAFLMGVSAAYFSIWHLLFSLLLICILLVVAVVDFRFLLVPTSYVYFAAIVTLFYNYFSLSSLDFVMGVLAGFVAAFFFLLIILVTRGKGMGEGDVPLAFLIGLVLGPLGGLVAFFLGFFAGAVVSVFLLVFGKKKLGQAVPFAPFLILGFFLSFFWAPLIISWYLMLY